MLNMDDKTFEKEYLTVQQAAKYLGVSSQTMRRWDAEGKLKSVRHPGNDYRYYKRADLEHLRGQGDAVLGAVNAPVQDVRHAIGPAKRHDLVGPWRIEIRARGPEHHGVQIGDAFDHVLRERHRHAGIRAVVVAQTAAEWDDCHACHVRGDRIER